MQNLKERQPGKNGRPSMVLVKTADLQSFETKVADPCVRIKYGASEINGTPSEIAQNWQTKLNINGILLTPDLEITFTYFQYTIFFHLLPALCRRTIIHSLLPESTKIMRNAQILLDQSIWRYATCLTPKL